MGGNTGEIQIVGSADPKQVIITTGGTFHGEMDRSRENQGWTMACNGMPERDGKNQEEDSPKQTDSCWFARPC